jgi:hypothetical protein
MIIRDFNIVGVPIPIEAESPLIIDSDAVLALAITGELLQLIAWEVQIAQFLCCMELPELAKRSVGYVFEFSIISSMM